MKFLNKHKGKIFISIFILFTLYTVYDTYDFENKSEVKTEKTNQIVKKEEKEPKETKVLIDIKGEIITPGVYELTTNNTVMDAINKAGGLTKTSDTSNINLSKKLEDEMVIIIYSKEEIKQMKEDKVECPPCNNACIKEDDEKAKIDKEETKETLVNGKININEASLEELQTLDGIGEAKANAIIEYRNNNGSFKSIEDIKNVSGIGDSIYEKIKNNITV